MFPSPFVGLLLMAIPGLGPIAGLLSISFAVISGIKLAMDAIGIMKAIEAKAPHLLPELHHLAALLGIEPEHAAKTLFAPHLLSNAERDHWTDQLNKARNL